MRACTSLFYQATLKMRYRIHPAIYCHKLAFFIHKLHHNELFSL